jgi:hypothetical protein
MLNVIKLSFIMLSVIMLNVIMLSVIMLIFILLSVVAPIRAVHKSTPWDRIHNTSRPDVFFHDKRR